MLELYGGRSCPFTLELRERLDWEGREFVEYDVESDAAARARLAQLLPGACAIPVLVEDGAISVVGWQGRTCFVGGTS